MADGAVALATRRGLRRLHATMEAFEAQLQCPICLCAYEKPASLPCNHCFCEECIHRALELKAVCPICKAPAKKRSLRHDTMIQQLQQAAELWAAVALPDELCVQEHEDKPPQLQAKATTPIRINPLIAAAAHETPVGEILDVQSSSSSDGNVRRRKRESPTRANGKRLETEPILAAVVAEPTVEEPDDDEEEETVEGAEKDEDEEDMSEGDERESGSEYEEELDAVESKARPPDGDELMPAAKRQRTTTNGIDTNGAHYRATYTNGYHAETTNGTSHDDSATGSSFQVGQLVEVMDRTWRGINKPGGAAWISKVCDNGTYDVKYIIGNGRETGVLDQYILIPREEIGSLATPGRAVKQHRRKQTKLITPPSVDLLGGNGLAVNGAVKSKSRTSDLVLLCSGYKEEEFDQIQLWAAAMGAQIVDQWSHFVTHLVARCATPKEVLASLAEDDHYHGATSGGSSAPARKRSLFKEELRKRWVVIRSMKYLKALVGGRWIVSEEWLHDCVKQGRRLAEAAYEADGHLKAQNVVAACQRSRTMREKILRNVPEETTPSTVGTRLFADYCFHIYGEFLPPMPPPTELDLLVSIGGGKTIHFLDDIALEMDKPENSGRTLVIVSDKLNQQMLRRAAKELTALPQLQGVAHKHVVSYQWILNSISEAKLRAFS